MRDNSRINAENILLKEKLENILNEKQLILDQNEANKCKISSLETDSLGFKKQIDQLEKEKEQTSKHFNDKFRINAENILLKERLEKIQSEKLSILEQNAAVSQGFKKQIDQLEKEKEQTSKHLNYKCQINAENIFLKEKLKNIQTENKTILDQNEAIKSKISQLDSVSKGHKLKIDQLEEEKKQMSKHSNH